MSRDLYIVSRNLFIVCFGRGLQQVPAIDHGMKEGRLSLPSLLHNYINRVDYIEKERVHGQDVYEKEFEVRRRRQPPLLLFLLALYYSYLHYIILTTMFIVTLLLLLLSCVVLLATLIT